MGKIFLFITAFAISPETASAEGLGCGGGLGPLAELFCNTKKGQEEVAANKLNSVISMVIGFFTVIAVLFFFIQFILAGFSWISAGGDKGKVETAQHRLTYSLIGLLIVVAAWTIMGVIGKILGIDILNPGSLLLNLSGDL